MTIISQSAETDIAEGLAVRKLYRSDAETAIREVVEEWLRQRFPAARLMHEVNMCQGGARVDVLAVAADHMAGVEIKGPWDNSARLINQLAAFRMALPELWLFCAGVMASETVGVVRYLFPTIGIAEVWHGDLGPSGGEVWDERSYHDAWCGRAKQVDGERLVDQGHP